MSITADEVLGQFDASHAAYTFPDLGHGYYYASTADCICTATRWDGPS